MAQPRESALQRIQFGIFGLVAVLIVVFVANVMYSGSSETTEAVAQSEAPEIELPKKAAVPDEPLAELGVAPTVDAGTAKSKPAPLKEADLDGPNTAPVE